MYLWLLIVLALTLQEGLSVLAVLLRAYELHYSLWIIHAIWLSLAIIQIAVAYVVGKWAQRSLLTNKFRAWVDKALDILEENVGTQGEKIALIILGYFLFPAAATFIASWLEISFLDIFLFVLLGNALWYAAIWATVLGAAQILARVKDGILVLIVIAFVVALISHFRKQK